ncbi:MAG: SDR family NAD(P)-dependent oxidoreductase [Hyphomicrobiaceae bacterium]|nr:SDR family NAD(P)-dependent oxidoreductase [Hyphomicrobiaceae bacterium]MCC0024669.1 SDR family NAD(P)-dependent oxidoreductase [Hyphomicrobiaceae bacterium]
MAEKRDLEDRVVVVTGASRGIGYFAAREAAARGANVIAVARTVGGLEDLDDEIRAMGNSATLVPADLRDGEALDQLGGAIYARWGKVDGVIANAGALGILSPVSHIPPNDVELVMDVNVTSIFRLIRSLDPLLRQSDAGRFTALSSAAADSAKPFWSLYAASKAAVNALVKSYAGELANTAIKANVVYPGAVRTQMRAKAFPGEDPQSLPHPSELASAIVDTISPDFSETGMIIDIGQGKSRTL